jgi:outer membrane protein TolC
MMIGPDYRHPSVPVAPDWIARDWKGIAPSAEPIGPWWESFHDQVLTDMIIEAYRQNPSLQAAGIRVIEAQARRGIAIGTLFPQSQNLVGAYTRNVASKNLALTPPDRGFNDFLLGFDVAWELDLWGKFRRGIESADADVLAALANYDDVLVSLLAEVAANYIGIRTAQGELEVSRDNAELQRKSFNIASDRAKHGAVTDVDPAQAATLLYGTEAQIPVFEAQIDQLAATLSALLGIRRAGWRSSSGPRPDRSRSPRTRSRSASQPTSSAAAGRAAEASDSSPRRARGSGSRRPTCFPICRSSATSASKRRMRRSSSRAGASRRSADRPSAGRSSTMAASRTTSACRMRSIRRS